MLVVCLLAAHLPAAPAVQLLVGGLAGLLTYGATALSRTEMRQLIGLLPWQRTTHDPTA